MNLIAVLKNKNESVAYHSLSLSKFFYNSAKKYKFCGKVTCILDKKCIAFASLYICISSLK